ncbi:MAG: SOS response-associated peptidase [Bacteroidota bacterium]
MCGRYVLIDGNVIFAASAQLQTWRNQGIEFDILPKYDARPSELMPVVALRDNHYQVQLMRWGLVPHWSNNGKTAFSTFNAKSETLLASNLFSPYFKSARCLVPANGFFEWKKFAVQSEAKGKIPSAKQKQKMFIAMKDGAPFMMAGLFSVWKNAAGDEFPTYTIITTAANELLKNIHDRMPVILEPKDYDVWLNRRMKDTDFLKTLLVPYPAERMTAFPVTNQSTESPETIEKITFEVPAAHDLAKITKPVASKRLRGA